MCTQEVCKDGEVSFGSRKDWIDHLNSHDVCGLGLVECPFCSMELESKMKDSYHKHVGYHFEEIRLLSLPLYFRRGSGGNGGAWDSSDDDEPEPHTSARDLRFYSCRENPP